MTTAAATPERTFLRQNDAVPLHSFDAVHFHQESKMTAPAGLGALHEEHGAIERVVAGMAQLAADMKNGKPADPDMLSGLVEFLRVFGDECHHKKEEAYLFPALISKGVPVNGCPIGALKNEHEKGRALVSDLASAAEAYISTDGRSRDALVRALDGLVELYPGHIWKEEYLLFPLAEKVLSRAELQELSGHMETFEAEKDPRLRERMEEFAERLQYEFHTGPQRPPQPTEGPYLTFDLAQEAERLRHEPAWVSGRNSRTMLKHSDLRLVLIVLRAKHGMQEHHTDANISVQTVAGHIRVRAGGKTFDLPAGNLLAIERGLPHDVEAVEDSTFLLTLAWPANGRKHSPH